MVSKVKETEQETGEMRILYRTGSPSSTLYSSAILQHDECLIEVDFVSLMQVANHSPLNMQLLTRRAYVEMQVGWCR